MSLECLKAFTEQTNYNYNSPKESSIGKIQISAMDLAESLKLNHDDFLALAPYLFTKEEYFDGSSKEYNDLQEADKYVNNMFNKEVNMGMTR